MEPKPAPRDDVNLVDLHDALKDEEPEADPCDSGPDDDADEEGRALRSEGVW